MEKGNDNFSKMREAKTLIEIHCSLLLVGWTVLSLAILISGRYLINITRHWKWIHIVSGSLIAVGTVVLNIALYAMVGKVGQLHGIAALILGILCSFECCHGAYVYLLRDKPKNDDTRSCIHKWIHRIVGWVAIAIAMIANHTGIWLKAPDQKYVFFAYYPIYGVILFVFYFFLYRRAYRQRKTGNLDLKAITYGYSSIIELNEKGAQYAFYENSVIDLKRFSRLHPGSQNFLDPYVGQELSRYIYGKMPCDIFNPHIHSKDSEKLFVSMKVAELPNPTAELIFMNHTIENKIFKIVSTNVVTPSFTCFKFVNPNVSLRIMADGLNHIGKYYSLFSTITGVGRNYCNSFAMSPSIYAGHIEAAKDYILEKGITCKFPSINNATKDGVEIYIKKKNDFSKFVFDTSTNLAGINNSFYIKGPFGGGILLNSQRAQKAVFLSCGVGSIPIVDIACYILRYMIVKSGKGSLFTDEEMTYDISNLKVIMFSSFHNENDVIGREIFELVDQICKKANSEAFRYYLRLSERKDPYWTDESFKDTLGNIADVDKVFISAPPALEKKLIGNMTNIGIHKSKIEIM